MGGGGGGGGGVGGGMMKEGVGGTKLQERRKDCRGKKNVWRERRQK